MRHLILCQSCGEKLKSPDTDSWLVEHRSTNRAVCHLTGFSMPMPKTCLKCGAEESFKSVGPGVERISEEVSILFPNANVEILSSDTSVMQRSWPQECYEWKKEKLI